MNANQRKKLQRLALTFKEKYAVDFFCRRNWPKLDGIMIHINEVKPNNTGSGFKEESLKKRSKTQVTVLGASEGALERFRAALNPQINKDTFTYFETSNPFEFCAQMEEDSDKEENNEEE